MHNCQRQPWISKSFPLDNIRSSPCEEWYRPGLDERVVCTTLPGKSPTLHNVLTVRHQNDLINYQVVSPVKFQRRFQKLLCPCTPSSPFLPNSRFNCYYSPLNISYVLPPRAVYTRDSMKTPTVAYATTAEISHTQQKSAEWPVCMARRTRMR